MSSKSLQKELKQTKPFRSIEEEAYLALARTSARLDHATAQGLKPFDITPTQYNVLRILRGAAEQGLCRNEIGERLVTSVPDVTRLLDRMEDMGWIQRQRSVVDRRLVSTTLTAKGMRLVNELDAHICHLHRDQLGHVDPKRLRTLIAILDDVRDRR